MFPRDSIHLTTLSRLRHPVILPIIESCDVIPHLLSLDQPNRMRYFSLPSRSTYGSDPRVVVVYGCADAARMRSTIEGRTGLSISPVCDSSRHIVSILALASQCDVSVVDLLVCFRSVL